jgi:hypothetical protein
LFCIVLFFYYRVCTTTQKTTIEKNGVIWGTKWAGPPQDLREVTKDEAGTALRSLVRAAAGPELKFWAGVETTAGELAAVATSGAGLAKKQFKVFDPGRTLGFSD